MQQVQDVAPRSEIKAVTASHRHQKMYEVSASTPFLLLKYGIPTLETGEAKPTASRFKSSSLGNKDKAAKNVGITGKAPEGKPVDDASSIDQLLNTMFRPFEFKTSTGACYVQRVSVAPATRLDVIALYEELNLQLERQRAKECGICPVREALYSECFNEIIRQVTVGCVERGKLLFRIKSEFDNTKAAWKQLYESVTKYGVRKRYNNRKNSLRERQEITRLTEEIKQLQEEEQKQKLEFENLTTAGMQEMAAATQSHHRTIATMMATARTLQERIELFLFSQQDTFPSNSCYPEISDGGRQM